MKHSSRTVSRLPLYVLSASLLASPALFAQSAPVAAAPQSQPQPVSQSAPPQTAAATGQTLVVPAGTKIPLTLKAAISTSTAKPGDAVYLTSDFPVIQSGRVVIPAGVFVQGYIDGVERGGKVKGRAQIMMHFVSMAFPNGVVIALPGAVDNVPGAQNAQVKDKEGLIEAKSNKLDDAKTVGGATVAGAGIGGLAGWAAGSPGLGIGIGAGAGAAAGVVEMFMKHGSDITFQAGTNVTMVMQRPLEVQEQQLQGMTALTGYEGPVTSPAPVNPPQNQLPKPQPQSQSN